ncbi:MAG: M56 family metallopeptidase [Lachnospiraceae bacterium]|nr:M56 family metallopeptidase [Lachnospiraceae bacterium]
MADTIFSVSVSIVLILLIRKLFAKQVPARFIYALWLIPAIQLLLFGHSLYFEPKFYYEIFDNIEKSPLQRIAPNVYDVLEQNLNQVLIQGESFVPELMEKKEMTMVHAGISVWEFLRIIWVAGAVITALCLFVPLFRAWRHIRRHRQSKPERLYGQKVYPVKNLSHSCLFCGKIYVDSEQQKNEIWSPFIVRHEAMHRRQGDDLWNLLRGLCVVLYWFHPLVWLAAFVSKTDSEYACDERTMHKMTEEEKRSYGKTLLELTTMESYTQKKGFASYGIGGGELKERIKRITAKEVKGKTIKKTAFFISTLLMVLLIGTFAQYGVVRLVESGQYKKIQTYVSYPVSEQIHADSVTYQDGQLYTIIKSDTDELCEITDKWLEVEKNGLFNVVVKNNLQTKEIFGDPQLQFNFVVKSNVQRKEKIVFHLGAKRIIEADPMLEPGKRWAEVSVGYDSKYRFLVDSLKEEFSNNYPELKNGDYRMNYVLWYRETDKYELLRVPFSVRNH